MSNQTNVSDYVKKLNEEDHRYYFEKLTLPNGEKLQDPYSIPSSMWKKDMSFWPEITYPDIFSYFVLGSRLYSQQEMKTPKSLDGYQFFISGHVQTLRTFKCLGHFYLRANVLPSQRQGKTSKMYDTYLVTNESGEIVTAHCTCMAGMGKSCSHAAAIAFKVEVAVRTGITQKSCTSQACSWNDLSKTQAIPCQVQQLDIKKRKYGDGKDLNIVKEYKPEKRSYPLPSPHTVKMLEELKKIQPDAVIFTLTEAKPPTENSFPETIPEVVREYKNLEPLSIFNNLDLTLEKDKVSNLEQATVNQSDNKLWHLHRLGRITSSRMHQVYTLKEKTPRTKMIEKVTGTSKPFTTSSTKYGLDNEPIARQRYSKYQGIIHDNFHCSLSGLVLNKEYPHLGASPDGLVECDCCGKGCLEIKCFHTYNSGIPDPLGETCSTFPIDKDFQLKKSTKYYTQVQGHMLITGRSYCDFYMWSEKNSLAVREFRDDAFINKLLLKLKHEYLTYVLPAMAQNC